VTWHEVGHPAGYAAAWRNQFGDDTPPPRAFRHGPLQALVGREPAVDGDHRWHVSVSHTDRVPAWEELVDAAHQLRPGVCFALGLPPRSWWLNLHPHVLHLWELHDEHLIDEWRRNARGDTPT
jgi:hypothetical protein